MTLLFIIRPVVDEAYRRIYHIQNKKIPGIELNVLLDGRLSEIRRCKAGSVQSDPGGTHKHKYRRKYRHERD